MPLDPTNFARLPEPDLTKRPATLADLSVVTSWTRNQEELERWTGPRYTYPLDPTTLPEQFDWVTSESWIVADGDGPVAFGQLIPRGPGRQHFARIITAPRRRGAGIGAHLVGHLLARAEAQGAAVATLNVRPGNDEALRLYLRLGFVEAVRPPEDAPLPSTFLAYRFLG